MVAIFFRNIPSTTKHIYGKISIANWTIKWKSQYSKQLPTNQKLNPHYDYKVSSGRHIHPSEAFIHVYIGSRQILLIGLIKHNIGKQDWHFPHSSLYSIELSEFILLVNMVSHLSLLLLLCVSTVISPTVAEVLNQSFVIRLKEMEQLIQDQKQVIDSLKSGNFITNLSSNAMHDKTVQFIKVWLMLI